MKTVHKLILKSYAGPMVLTFFIVLFVFIMQFMWRYIDELVGKGLGMDVILELMMYAAVTLIPMVLPLATLFAAVMTMGNMGENYELLALKSAGISLPKIMRPLIILVLFVAVGSFFVANNLVPIATKKISALLYDIRQQKQSIEFKDGLFFNGMDDISIRVDRQDPKTKLLNGVLIYDTNGITRHPVRKDIEVYAIDATAECARMGQAKLFNTMILGGYLKVRPVVAMENVMVGLKKSLPERAWKMLPANEEAIRHGGEIIRKR